MAARKKRHKATASCKTLKECQKLAREYKRKYEDANAGWDRCVRVWERCVSSKN